MKMLMFVVLGLLACNTLAQENEATEAQDETGIYEHPCYHKGCGAGFECELDEAGDPICICIRECTPQVNPIKVCTTQNVTFESECDFLRQKCLCSHDNSECKNNEYGSAHLDYFGPCIELAECEEEELEEFPNRMRNWLYLIMDELDSRNDLNEAAHNMVLEAKNLEHPWALAVIWKFCDLDMTADRFVSQEELMPITAPLKPLEHCTGTFLENCDDNNDGNIDLEEWGKCLGLDPEEVEDRCDSLRN